MAQPFTHTFDINLNDISIKGEVEFNQDGEASFKFDEVSSPVKNTFLVHFTQLMQHITNIYDSNATNKEIRHFIIKLKEE